MKCTFSGLSLLLGLSGPVLAFDHFAIVDSDEQYCFAKAMVGMDSVINAGFGVPPEHALDLVIPGGNIAVLNDKKTVDMLNTILNAYFWKDTPHTYAVKVFFQCAVDIGGGEQTIAHNPDGME